MNLPGVIRTVAPMVLLPLVGLVIALGLFEVTVRLVLSRGGPVTVSDRPTLYIFPAKSGSARDYFYEEAKPANTFRIAVVGDSFAFGFNNLFDDAFPKRLERILNLNIEQPKVEVLNFGTPSLSTKDEVALVDTAIRKYHADLVVLEVTLNDPEVVPYHNPRGPMSQRMSGGLLKGGILDWWKGLAFILTKIEVYRSQKEYVRYFNSLYENPVSAASFANSLTKVADRGRESNTKIVALIFPLLAMPLDERYPFEAIHKRIQSLLRERQVPFLDLRDTYRGMAHDRLQAIPGEDPHPSELGHRIAAEALEKFLRKLKLLPAAVIPKQVNVRRDVQRFLPDDRP